MTTNPARLDQLTAALATARAALDQAAEHLSALRIEARDTNTPDQVTDQALDRSCCPSRTSRGHVREQDQR